mmetsp:Transcript_45872/g.132856  ORF Transcript_45872/g.132856 Transcript_45872/m.132856 type:complete len:219 (-) Transcript_45872:816-1472(-)
MQADVFTRKLPVKLKGVHEWICRDVLEEVRRGERIVRREEGHGGRHPEAVVEVSLPEADPAKVLVELLRCESRGRNVVVVIVIDLVADPLPGLILMATRHPAEDGPLWRPPQGNREVVLHVLVPARRKSHVGAAALVGEGLTVPQELRAVPHPCNADLLAVLLRVVHAHDSDTALKKRPYVVGFAMNDNLPGCRHLHSALTQAKHAVVLLLPLLCEHL